MAGDKAEGRGWGTGVMLGLDEGRSGEEKPQLTSGLYSALSRHIAIQHISPIQIQFQSSPAKWSCLVCLLILSC